MYNYRGWSKTKERKVIKPVSGVYSVTTSTYRKILVYADTPIQATNNAMVSLNRDEYILTVGRDNGK